MNQELRIIILIVAAFCIGLAVLVFKPDYRISNNLFSNMDYYPAVLKSEPVPPAPVDAGDVPPENTPVDDDSLALPDDITSRDYEF